MNRLMVIHYPFFGGPHNQALRLDARLRQQGIQTTVVLPNEPGNAACRLRAAGVDVVEVRLSRLRARPDPRVQIRLPAECVRDVASLRRLVRRRSIDLVEVNGLVNPQAAIAARLESAAVVWQLLDTRAPMFLRRVTMPLVRRLADVVMTTGMTVARVHPGALRLGDRLIPFFPPVDTSVFRPNETGRARARSELDLPVDAPLVGCLANLTPQKGLEHFVDSATRLADENSRVHFVILGRRMETQEGYRVRLEAKSRHLLESGRLRILDPGDRVAELLPALDVFLATSVARSEGIPTTILEAMASGLPVVTTNVGSIAEVIQDGHTGYVVPPVDVHELVARTRLLLGDPVLRKRIGVAARARAVEQFDAGACATTHLVAFERALARRQAWSST